MASQIEITAALSNDQRLFSLLVDKAGMDSAINIRGKEALKKNPNQEPAAVWAEIIFGLALGAIPNLQSMELDDAVEAILSNDQNAADVRGEILEAELKIPRGSRYSQGGRTEQDERRALYDAWFQALSASWGMEPYERIVAEGEPGAPVTPSPTFEAYLGDVFDKAFQAAKKTGRIGYTDDTGQKKVYDETEFLNFATEWQAGNLEQFDFTPEDYAATQEEELASERKKLADIAATAAAQRAKDLQKKMDDIAEKNAENLKQLTKDSITTALRNAGLLSSTATRDELSLAQEFTQDLIEEYDVSKDLGSPFNLSDRIKTKVSQQLLDNLQLGATKGVIPMATSEGVRLSAEANIARIQEKMNAGTATEEERGSLLGWQQQLASVSGGSITVEAATKDRVTRGVIQVPKGMEGQFNTLVNQYLQDEGLGLEEARRNAAQDLGITLPDDVVTPGREAKVVTAAELDLSGFPTVPGGAQTSFGGTTMAQRFGTGGGGGQNVNYSPSGQLQEVAGGGYVDMGKVQEIISTYGLGGDPMLREPGFLEFIIERDKALREGYKAEQEGLESAYSRSVGRYGEVDPILDSGPPPIPLTSEDVAAGRGAPGVTGQDPRGATMQKELTGQLERFPTFGDYLKTVTRDQFTTGFEKKDITERKTKRVGVML